MPRRTGRASADDVILQAVESIVERASAGIARAISDILAARIDEELKAQVAKAVGKGRGGRGRQGARRRAPAAREVGGRPAGPPGPQLRHRADRPEDQEADRRQVRRQRHLREGQAGAQGQVGGAGRSVSPPSCAPSSPAPRLRRASARLAGAGAGGAAAPSALAAAGGVGLRLRLGGGGALRALLGRGLLLLGGVEVRVPAAPLQLEGAARHQLGELPAAALVAARRRRVVHLLQLLVDLPAALAEVLVDRHAPIIGAGGPASKGMALTIAAGSARGGGRRPGGRPACRAGPLRAPPRGAPRGPPRPSRPPRADPGAPAGKGAGPEREAQDEPVHRGAGEGEAAPQVGGAGPAAADGEGAQLLGQPLRGGPPRSGGGARGRRGTPPPRRSGGPARPGSPCAPGRGGGPRGSPRPAGPARAGHERAPEVGGRGAEVAGHPDRDAAVLAEGVEHEGPLPLGEAAGEAVVRRGGGRGPRRSGAPPPADQPDARAARIAVRLAPQLPHQPVEDRAPRLPVEQVDGGRRGRGGGGGLHAVPDPADPRAGAPGGGIAPPARPSLRGARFDRRARPGHDAPGEGERGRPGRGRAPGGGSARMAFTASNSSQPSGSSTWRTTSSCTGRPGLGAPPHGAVEDLPVDLRHRGARCDAATAQSSRRAAADARPRRNPAGRIVECGRPIGKMAPMPPSPRDVELSPAARSARVALYLLLLGGGRGGPPHPDRERARRRPGRRAELLVAPVLLGAFAIGFTAYRFTLVRGGKYHAGKAFVQVGLLGLVLFLFVPGLGGALEGLGGDPARRPDPAAALRRSGGPRHGRRAGPPPPARGRPPLRAAPGRSCCPTRRPRSAARPAPRSRRWPGRTSAGEGPDAADRWRAYWSARGVAFPPVARRPRWGGASSRLPSASAMG